MNLLSKYIVLLVLGGFLSLSGGAQNGYFSIGNKDGTKFKGFGIGTEYYTGHSEMGKLVKWKKPATEGFVRGIGIYVSYFRANPSNKIQYYIDAGVVFWHSGNLIEEGDFYQRSELLQFSGRYAIGKFGIVGRIGGLMNHDISATGNAFHPIKPFTLTTGLGVSIPIPIKKVKGLGALFMVSRVNNLYTWSGTIIIPIVFHK